MKKPQIHLFEMGNEYDKAIIFFNTIIEHIERWVLQNKGRLALFEVEHTDKIPSKIEIDAIKEMFTKDSFDSILQKLPIEKLVIYVRITVRDFNLYMCGLAEREFNDDGLIVYRYNKKFENLLMREVKKDLKKLGYLKD